MGEKAIFFKAELFFLLEQILALLPRGWIGNKTRAAYWSRKIKGKPRGLIIYPGTHIFSPQDCYFGHRISLGYNVHVNPAGKGFIHIGDNVLIGPNCVLRAADHIFDDPTIPIRDQEAEEIQGRVDLAVSLEVIEHVHEPLDFCRALRSLLRDGGRMLLTGLTADGFDIQVLWEHSKSVSPPHHINLISVRGFAALLKRAGFSEVRVFTPGKLDVDIVRNAWRESPHLLQGQRFIRRLLGGEVTVRQAFQKFLSEHQFSSHCWIWAAK